MIAISKYIKAVAALAGGLTPPLLVVIASVVGLKLSPDTAALVIGILSPLLSTVATWAAPANQSPVVWTRTGSVPEQPAP